MFITKRHIPRRTFLKGAGAALALPLLEAMVPAGTLLAQTAAAPAKSRFVGIFFPHGMGPGYWVPEAEGALTEMPYILESLKNVKDQTVGHERPVVEVGRTAGRHDRFGSLGGRGVPDGQQAAQDRRLRRHGWQPDDRSADRAEDRPGQPDAVAAAGLRGSELELEQLRRRVQLLLHELDLVGRSAAVRKSGRHHPADEPAADGAQPAGRLRASVRQRRDARAARRATEPEPEHSGFGARRAGQPARTPSAPATAGPSISTRDEIREIERRLQIAAKASTNVPEMALPSGIPEQFDDHIKLHFDLTALAFQADITRVMTLLGGRDLTGRAFTFPKSELFPEGGVSPSWHGASHHGDTADGIKRFADLNRYHVSTMARFAEKLKATPDGDGNAARSFADSLRDQHGQLESASALRRGPHPGRRRQRQAQGRTPSGLRPQNRHDRKPAASASWTCTAFRRDKQGDSTGPLPKL